MKTILAALFLTSLATGCINTSVSSTTPSADAPWVIRTFADRPELWESLKQKIAAPVGPYKFTADVRYVDDSRYYGLTGIQLVNTLPPDYQAGFVFAANGNVSPANENTMTMHYFYPESTSLADYERPPSAVPASDLQSVVHLPGATQDLENNLSIGNVGMADILVNLPEDGIHRPIAY